MTYTKPFRIKKISPVELRTQKLSVKNIAVLTHFESIFHMNSTQTVSPLFVASVKIKALSEHNPHSNKTYVFPESESYAIFLAKSEYVVYFLTVAYFVFLPFYVYVNKVNRRRDEKMIIFPITNDFYKMVIITVLLYIFYAAMAIFVDHGNLKEGNMTVFGYLMFTAHYTLCLSIQVFYWLIVALAIERFLLYFCPSTEKLITSVRNYAMHYSMEILIILSSLLYLPIMISVRKLFHLASAEQNQPQRYIFWQTMVVLIFKSVFTIPLMIMMSYLGCNKRDLTVTFTSFNLKYFLRTIFSFYDAIVQPQVGSVYTLST
nr:hypothetical protein F40D4.10 - Caenorhabditis elegans [Caenorhabditis elegans]